MRKIYSILYKSQLQPQIVALHSVEAIDATDANKKALAEVCRINGDKMWQPACSIELQLQDVVSSETIQPLFQNAQNALEKDKNFLMKCIIDNKDIQFFNLARKYMTEQEIKYCEEKIR